MTNDNTPNEPITQARSVDANRERAARAEGILQRCSTDADLHTSLVDLLADAMHWCDHNGEDFHLALAQACRHYIHELNDEQQDERRMQP